MNPAEVAPLFENALFEVVERPTNKPVITSKWVFKKKRGLSRQLVARGFMQEEGLDYAETYSPTVRFENIRILIAAAASEDVRTILSYAPNTIVTVRYIESDL